MRTTDNLDQVTPPVQIVNDHQRTVKSSGADQQAARALVRGRYQPMKRGWEVWEREEGGGGAIRGAEILLTGSVDVSCSLKRQRGSCVAADGVGSK